MEVVAGEVRGDEVQGEDGGAGGRGQDWRL